MPNPSIPFFLAAVLSLTTGMARSEPAAETLIATRSTHTVRETIDRVEAAATGRGLKIFARVDHAAGATSVGLPLRPTELLIFGHPKGGTPFMECAQTVGIDLPLKVLAWEDAESRVWLAYDDPAALARRHGVEGCAAVAPLTQLLAGLVAAAAGP